MTHRFALCVFIVVLAIGAAKSVPTWSRHSVLLWPVALPPSQCSTWPCINICALNATSGKVLWLAYSTPSNAIRGAFSGHHSIYLTTWSGPGLYAVNPTNGHVRWQWPLDRWLRYWLKDIDLPHSASFQDAREAGRRVHLSAQGPPARLYGLHSRGGRRAWEFVPDELGAELAALEGSLSPDVPAPPGGRNGSSSSSSGALYAAFALPEGISGSSSGWLQALDGQSGEPLWRTQLAAAGRVSELLAADSSSSSSILAHSSSSSSILAHSSSSSAGKGLLFVAAAGVPQPPDADGSCRGPAAECGGVLLSLNASDGGLVWRHDGQYCTSPPPLHAGRLGGVLLLPPRCNSLSGMLALDAASGQMLWSGFDVSAWAAPSGPCTWVAEGRAGALLFGCGCDGKPVSSSALMATPLAATGAVAGAAAGAAAAAATAAATTTTTTRTSSSGLCAYSIQASSGKLLWAAALPGAPGGMFALDAQASGASPLLTPRLAVFAASDRLVAVRTDNGAAAWSRSLAPGDVLQHTSPPVLDRHANVIIAAVTSGGRPNHTALLGIAADDGLLLWRRELNGSVPPTSLAGLERAVRAAPSLLLAGGHAHVETCGGSTCCLRAFNTSDGRRAWGICLSATRGEDATQPRAAFLIWLVTLGAAGCIALLLLGAVVVYVSRWHAERALLGGSSPLARHTYRPLPDTSRRRAAYGHGDSDSDDDGMPPPPPRWAPPR